MVSNIDQGNTPAVGGHRRIHLFVEQLHHSFGFRSLGGSSSPLKTQSGDFRRRRLPDPGHGLYLRHVMADDIGHHIALLRPAAADQLQCQRTVSEFLE